MLFTIAYRLPVRPPSKHAISNRGPGGGISGSHRRAGRIRLLPSLELTVGRAVAMSLDVVDVVGTQNACKFVRQIIMSRLRGVRQTRPVFQRQAAFTRGTHSQPCRRSQPREGRQKADHDALLLTTQCSEGSAQSATDQHPRGAALGATGAADASPRLMGSKSRNSGYPARWLRRIGRAKSVKSACVQATLAYKVPSNSRALLAMPRTVHARAQDCELCVCVRANVTRAYKAPIISRALLAKLESSR